MRTIFPALFCFLLCPAPAWEQSPSVASGAETPAFAVRDETPIAPVESETRLAAIRGKPPIAPGKGKTIELSFGYSYVGSGKSLFDRMGLQGPDASFTIGFSHLGVKADFDYARASNVMGTGHHSDVLSYMAGPVFYPMRNRRFDTYVQTLVGGARVSGPVRLSNGGILLGGWATGYAWAVGGGINYWASDSLAIRTGVDYLRTAYYDPSLTIRGQANIRTTATVVYFFGMRSAKRR
jgi:opacity protein-like surface antigen